MELVWKERGSVVKSRTGSRGTHWNRRKGQQAKLPHQGLIIQGWRGEGWGWGRESCCAGWNDGIPEGERVAWSSWWIVGIWRGGTEPFCCHFVLVIVPVVTKLFSSEAAWAERTKGYCGKSKLCLNTSELSLARKREAKSWLCLWGGNEMWFGGWGRGRIGYLTYLTIVFVKTVHAYHKEFKSFWVMEMSLLVLSLTSSRTLGIRQPTRSRVGPSQLFSLSPSLPLS